MFVAKNMFRHCIAQGFKGESERVLPINLCEKVGSFNLLRPNADFFPFLDFLLAVADMHSKLELFDNHRLDRF